jgi:hypothetical protein
MTYEKPLGNFQHSRASRKPRVSRAAVETGQCIPTDGPCDGCEAMRLMHDRQTGERENVVDAICDRVAKFGGRA